METTVFDEPTETRVLLEQASTGDQSAVGKLFDLHRVRLYRMVQARMDRRLQRRVDPSDVLQEAFLEASCRLDKYLEAPNMPLFLWLRLLVAEKLISLHRKHLQAKKRDARHEVQLHGQPCPEASSVALMEHLTGSFDTPSQILVRAERVQLIKQAVESMSDIDREILTLRHFEQLSRSETAQTLDIEESAASKRYVRALQRLKKSLNSRPGEWRKSEHVG